MTKKILYLGDDSLKGAAAYLGAMLTKAGLAFEFCPSDKKADIKKGKYSLFILSDYPAKKLSKDNQRLIAEEVKAGAGLLMIGGWESFYGKNKEYYKTIIAELLPVVCQDSDDRLNYCQGLIPVLKLPHASVAKLPWAQPPVVCGCNLVGIKDGAKCILALKKLVINGGKATLAKQELPLLVIGKYGKGKTGALMTDLAPHWVGGMVDWGNARITAKAKNGNEVEVGNYYAQFCKQLVKSLLG